MLPSNSRLQRLSQTAVSRSQFLQFATGALLPFVGLSQPAAAVPNLEMAQTVARPGPTMQRRRAERGLSS